MAVLKYLIEIRDNVCRVHRGSVSNINIEFNDILIPSRDVELNILIISSHADNVVEKIFFITILLGYKV